ncbi:YeaH/YhbH family protein [Dasania marina]|uniref:YeaH/YhbH family protein n=1 Tax=Dasania marina TaxID=471499 RepID=UPI0030D762E6|tara:strand:+ start:39563 stop:40840 length:1278 start_codon:yes stop_codon:yes gene_type:complete
MSFIIDRRLNAKNKSTVNRQRFLKRYRKHIKKAVSDAIGKRSITDIEHGEQISIPSKEIDEPIFHHGQGGHSENVLPGNTDFITGDHIPRPPPGSGEGGSGPGASDKGEGEDDFIFNITQEEFLDFMFEDLELPNMIKRQLAGNEEFKIHRAGISNEGSPGKINIVRSLRSANARRIALTSSKRKKLAALQQELDQLQTVDMILRNHQRIELLTEEIEKLSKLIKRVPWLDNFDLKYNLHVKVPNPQSKAVMFCLMDVSGSMDQTTKDIAKRFFILLYLFLQRNYQRTEVVFIRHHTSASEVDEQEFFYSRETGGTIVSSALKLMKTIIDARYPSEQWNIYGAQASDGDNWNDDSSICRQLLSEDILPKVQYYSYIEITPREHQSLWEDYSIVQDQHPKSFAMQQLVDASEIYSVFRELFQKQIA